MNQVPGQFGGRPRTCTRTSSRFSTSGSPARTTTAPASADERQRRSNDHSRIHDHERWWLSEPAQTLAICRFLKARTSGWSSLESIPLISQKLRATRGRFRRYQAGCDNPRSEAAWFLLAGAVALRALFRCSFCRGLPRQPGPAIAGTTNGGATTPLVSHDFDQTPVGSIPPGLRGDDARLRSQGRRRHAAGVCSRSNAPAKATRAWSWAFSSPTICAGGL